MSNICTRSGKLVDPWHLKREDVDFTDVAWALSRIVRFVGHCDPAWTVADHTLFVARILRAWGLPARVQLLGLLHDAPEAYLSDLASPTKHHLPDYKLAEERAERAIEGAAKFGEWVDKVRVSVVAPLSRRGHDRTSPEVIEREWVKQADRVALCVEAERLLPRGAWKVDAGWVEIVKQAGTIECSHRTQVDLTLWERLRPRWWTRRAWLAEFRRLQKAA